MGGFPALMIKQPESPVQQLAGAQQVVAGQQELQMGAIKLQEAHQAQFESKFLMQLGRQNQGDLGKTIQDAQASGKVRPQTIMALQKQQLEMHTALATATEKDLANAKAFGDMAAGGLDEVLKVPEAERLKAIQRVLAGFAANNVPMQQIQGIQKQLASLPDLKDSTIQGVQSALIGHNKEVENALATRKTIASEAEASARASQAATAAAKVGPEVAHLQAQTALAQTQQQQAGQITEKDKYVQNMENYRAALSRQKATSDAIGKQGLDHLQKQSDAYSEFASKANVLKANIQASKDGNEMASAISPLAGTLFIVKGEGGISRINETEVRGIAGAGDLATRINGAISKQTTGASWPDSLKNDMVKLVDLYTDAKYQSYQKQASYTQKLHGLDAGTTPILDREGNTTTLRAPQATPTKSSTPPVNLLKEGIHTTFKNGQTWTLENGQAKQVTEKK